MTLNKIEHCTLSTYQVDNEIKIYDFIAEDKYCFYNTKNQLIDDNGNKYYEHFTAFSLLADEIDTLSDYECVLIEEGMVIY